MAHNKLLAKLASGTVQADGFLHVLPENVRATLDPLPVSRLWTVGKVAGAKLEREGIRSFRDLRLCPEERPARVVRIARPGIDPAGVGHRRAPGMRGPRGTSR
jgi:nucleotidyltransferase/DNA polymerase involved in DNA repair